MSLSVVVILPSHAISQLMLAFILQSAHYRAIMLQFMTNTAPVGPVWKTLADRGRTGGPVTRRPLLRDRAADGGRSSGTEPLTVAAPQGQSR